MASHFNLATALDTRRFAGAAAIAVTVTVIVAVTVLSSVGFEGTAQGNETKAGEVVLDQW